MNFVEELKALKEKNIEISDEKKIEILAKILTANMQIDANYTKLVEEVIDTVTLKENELSEIQAEIKKMEKNNG